MTHAAALPASSGADERSTLERAYSRITWRLIPFLATLWVLAWLDRVNIGYAKLQMLDDLAFSEAVYGLGAGIFFLGYFFFEVPSNLLLEKIGARKTIMRITIGWGLVCIAQMFVKTPGMFYFLRFLLGVFEAGFYPGIILYLTYWFPKRERAKATALFLLAIPLSTVIGAPFSAWLIGIGDGHIGAMSGWRFMFLAQGLPAIALGVICWFYLTDRPQQASWLSDEERAWLVDEMDHEHGQTAQRYHYPLKRALTNPRVLALSFVYFGTVYGLYALSFFLPTIIRGFATTFETTYSVMQVGLITAIPFAFGAAAMVLWSRHSDRTRERVWHVALPLFVGGVTIPIALYLGSPFLTMAAVTVCCMCICSTLPTFWPLPTMFLSGAAAAGGIALVNTIGNSAGFAAPYITGWLKDLTGSQNAGMWVIGVIMVLAGFTVLALKAAPVPDDAEAVETDHVRR